MTIFYKSCMAQDFFFTFLGSTEFFLLTVMPYDCYVAICKPLHYTTIMNSRLSYLSQLTEAKDIKKRWQEHTEELCKKDLHDPDNHSGVITYLEPDILECEVKWALESITRNKATGGDGIPVELF